MSEVSDYPKLASPGEAADQILAGIRSVGPAVFNAVTANEGLALNRAFQAIAAPQIRSYVIELVEALVIRARASGQN